MRSSGTSIRGNRGPLPEGAVRRLFERIIDEMRTLQRERMERRRPSMIVVMEAGATEQQIQTVIDRLVALEFSVHRSTGVVHTVLGGVGPAEAVDPVEFKVMEGVKECFPDHVALQTGQPAFQARRHGGRLWQSADRRTGSGRDGWAVQRRERRTDSRQR